MPVSEETYQLITLEDPDGQWELFRGQLREKPGMSSEHNDFMFYLGMLLQQGLDRRRYRVRSNSAHLRCPSGSIFIPDVVIVPLEFDQRFRGRPGVVEIFDEPMPLVVELWSASTGRFDAQTKIPEYQDRGDHEIWWLHPYDQTLAAWRRQRDGRYSYDSYQGGVVEALSLPGVTVDFGELFR
jgi:Uma2 family endonuclease